MAAHQQEPVRAITDYRPDVPPALCALLDRMLAKSPDDRPATPGEVAAALEQLGVGANLSALLPSTPGPRVIPERPRVRTPAPTPAPDSTVPVPAPTGRRMLGAALATALVSIGLAVYSIVSVPRPAPENPNGTPPPGDPKAPRKPREAGWHYLLAENHGARLKRLWRPTDVSLLLHNPDTEVLTIQSENPALIRLGEAPKPAYKLHVGFKQPRWTGGFGVYIGGYTEPEKNEFVFQLLTVQHDKVRPAGSDYTLNRGRGKYPLDPDPRPGINAGYFHSDFIPPPDNEEKLLELEVKPGGLAVVRWNGRDCPNVVSVATHATAKKMLRDGGIAGEFGIYCTNATVTVKTARYLSTE